MLRCHDSLPHNHRVLKDFCLHSMTTQYMNKENYKIKRFYTRTPEIISRLWRIYITYASCIPARFMNKDNSKINDFYSTFGNPFPFVANIHNLCFVHTQYMNKDNSKINDFYSTFGNPFPFVANITYASCID